MKKHQSALHLAVIQEDFSAVELLKNNPELVQQKNWMGFTPFELANLLGKKEIGEALRPHIEPLFALKKTKDAPVTFHPIIEFEQYFGITYLPTLCFANISLLEQVVKNCPWLLAYTVIGQEHRHLGASLRQKIMTGQVAQVSIEFIDEEIGYGLFAQEEIAKDAFVGTYTGIVRKIQRFSPELNAYCMHYPTRLWSYHYFVVDAEQAGNEMRFINHSEKPNLRPFSIIDRGLQHIALFATRHVAAGEELTFNYGKDYWKKRIADGRTRTSTWLPRVDFESTASTIPPHRLGRTKVYTKHRMVST